MSHTLYNHDDTTQTAGSETTVNPRESVAAGGQSFVLFTINNTGSQDFTPTDESITGTDASSFNVIRSGMRLIPFTDIPRSVIVIEFVPTSSGEKTAQYNLTVEGTSYEIPLVGTAATSASVAISVVEGAVPSGYVRESPCGIYANVDMDNTDLPAPWSECYFRWRITPPGSQTFTIQDRRTYDGATNRNLFLHYPGCAICIPVLEGQHGTWTLNLDCFVPGDDGDDPSLTATPVEVTVVALGTNKATYYATAAGAGSHNGSLGNEWTWAEAESNLAGTNNWHLIIAANEIMTGVDAQGFQTGAAKNWSIVGGDTGANRPIIQPSVSAENNICMQTGDVSNIAKSGWLQDLIFRPYPSVGSQVNDGLYTGMIKGLCLYRCDFTGDGVTNGVHNGDSFNSMIYFQQNNPAGFPPASDYCNGIGLITCFFESRRDYGYYGYGNCIVEVNTTMGGSTNESVLRWLGSEQYSPYQNNHGVFYYNAVDASHDTSDDDDGENDTKQAWRITHGRFFTLHRCYSKGTNWFGMRDRYSFNFRIDACDFNDNPPGASPVWTHGETSYDALVICCHFRKTESHHVPGDFCAMRDAGQGHRVIHVTSVTSGGDGGDTATIGASELCSNSLLISSFGHEEFGDASEGYSLANSIVNNVFPATADLEYNAGGNVYTTVAALNASVYAAGNIERNVTLNANGRPMQDVSGFGRDAKAYYDYHMTPMTATSTWAGMIQESGITPTSARLRLRIRTV